MALFPMTQYDFPNVSNYDSDLRELISMYEKLKVNYGELIRSIDLLSEHFDKIENEFKHINEIVNNAIDNAMEKYAEELLFIKNDINNLTVMVNNIYNSAIQYTDFKCAELLTQFNVELSNLQRQIDELIFKLPKVYNQTRGYETELIEYLDDVYNLTRDYAFCINAFDNRGMTCGELDSLDKTAIQWDINGLLFLYPPNVCQNPLTGEFQSVCKIFESLAQEIHTMSILTAQEYDSLLLTAEDYDSRELTAYEYDFYGKQLLSA